MRELLALRQQDAGAVSKESSYSVCVRKVVTSFKLGDLEQVLSLRLWAGMWRPGHVAGRRAALCLEIGLQSTVQ